jgi:hypothetical protein
MVGQIKMTEPHSSAGKTPPKIPIHKSRPFETSDILYFRDSFYFDVKIIKKYSPIIMLLIKI